MDITHIKDIDGEISNINSINIKDMSIEDLTNAIFDLNEDVMFRIDALEHYYTLKNDDIIEILSRLGGMYQFSGTKLLEDYLYRICTFSNLPSFVKLESAKSLLFFEEYPETIDPSIDDKKMITIKTKSNEGIISRNIDRKKRAYKALDSTCYLFNDSHQLATPCKIEAICFLMESPEYKNNSLCYFVEIINDTKIDCDYRYKSILSLEKLTKISDKNFFLFNSCLKFLHNDKNMTMYRILSGQYLLKKKPEGNSYYFDIFLSESDSPFSAIQNKILSFAFDEELDYNLRADAADTLLNLGEKHIQLQAREIIMVLGHHLGNVRSVYDNAQNVHATSIEKSVNEIIEYLSIIPPMTIDKNPINFGYINTTIEKHFEEKLGYCALYPLEKIFCEYCKSGSTIELLKTDKNFCSELCFSKWKKMRNIKISLNRIHIDRMLYSQYNQTLVNILIKIWTFIQTNEDNKEVLLERLLEELDEMCGTCSSGFASRLCNVISGFSDFSVRIDFEDQIIANFSGRLNSKMRDIKTNNFYRENHKEIVEIYMKEFGIEGSIENYLDTNKDEKITKAIEEFYENIMVELCNGMKDYSLKPNFKKFFIDILPNIKEELYSEFCEYMEDTDFDLYLRKAVMLYT